MSKVIHVKTCYDCPYLRLTAFSQGGFECKQSATKRIIVTADDADQWKKDNFVIPNWCPLVSLKTVDHTPEATQVAAKCCAIILSIDSNRGNEKQAAEFIAEEYKIDLHKLQEGEYDV